MVSVGISSGALAINVAHALMHRRGGVERAMAGLLMTSACDPHFCFEHVRGHHRNVATPTDPASARFGERVAAFLPRALAGSLAGAWRIEGDRVRRRGGGSLGFGDRRFRYPMVVLAAVAAARLAGYATMCLLALAPPLWRRFTDPRVAQSRGESRSG